jgi:hypothetical protein
MASKPGSQLCSGKVTEETCLPSVRCPVYRGRDSLSGSCTELENLAGDAKGKGTSGATARPKVPMRRRGTDCLVVVTNRGNARGAKGAGHRRLRLSQLATGRAPYFNGRRQPSIGGTSRISREAYVRICERLGVQFPGPTRQEQGPEMALAEDDDMVEALSSD